MLQSHLIGLFTFLRCSLGSLTLLMGVDGLLRSLFQMIKQEGLCSFTMTCCRLKTGVKVLTLVVDELWRESTAPRRLDWNCIILAENVKREA